MTNKINLAPAANEVRRLTNTVESSDYERPTPCETWTLRDLIGHLLGLSEAFTCAARKESFVPDDADPANAVDLDGGWKSALEAGLTELVAAWQEPDSWEGEAEAGGVTMPAAQIAVVALDELVLHGWDLARSTGQTFEVAQVDIEAVEGFVESMSGPEAADQRDGLFGSELTPDAGLSRFDRVLALSGRNPRWTADAT